LERGLRALKERGKRRSQCGVIHKFFEFHIILSTTNVENVIVFLAMIRIRIRFGYAFDCPPGSRNRK
jgi:hypothetical protein